MLNPFGWYEQALADSLKQAVQAGQIDLNNRPATPDRVVFEVWLKAITSMMDEDYREMFLPLDVEEQIRSFRNGFFAYPRFLEKFYEGGKNEGPTSH